MKPTPFHVLFLIVLLYIGCDSSSKKETNSEVLANSPVFYYYLGKDKRLSIDTRISHFNTAYQAANQQRIDSIALKSLSYISFLYKKKKIPDSSFIYAQSLLSLALQKQDSFYIGRAYFKIGEYYRAQNRPDSAFSFFNKSSMIFASLKDSTQTGKKLDLMGRILIDDSNYNLGEKILTNALLYLRPEKDSATLSSVYHNLSILYRKQYDYVKAKDYIFKAQRYQSNPAKTAILKNTALNILRENKEYSTVIASYTQLLKDSSVIRHQREYARVLDNLAYTQWLANPDASVYEDLYSALQIKEQQHDHAGRIASYVHLMEYFTSSDVSQSILYAQKLLTLTRQQNNVEDRVKALNHLRKYAIEKKEEYGDRLFTLLDSIHKIRNQSENKYAAIRYDANQKEKELIRSKKEQELMQQKQKTQTIVTLAIVLFLFLIIFAGIYFMQQRHKVEKLKERHTTEKRLSKKLHDEVGNDLYYLISQLQNPAQKSLQKTLHNFDLLYQKIRNFSRDHKVEVGEEYHDELLFLLTSFHNDNTKIITTGASAAFWATVANHKKEELYWVLKELLINMKKHSQASLVVITFKREKRKLIIRYKDDGIGVNLTDALSKNGLRNVETRIKDIKGNIIFESEPTKGFAARITIRP